MAKDDLPRLRASAPSQPLHIVLVEPEIPQNTGNIARLAGALKSPLHLVGELGFSVSDKAVRRAGLDYWHLVEVKRHATLADFGRAHRSASLKLFSAVATRSYLEATYDPGDALVFGCESTGLPQELLDAHPSQTYGLPTIGHVRSLNLANTVAVVLYEAHRQLGTFERLTLG